MLTTAAKPTELRPLTADEIDFVSGAQLKNYVTSPPTQGQYMLADGVYGTVSTTTKGNAHASATVISNSPGSIIEISTAVVIGGGSASSSTTAFSPT